MCRAGNDLLHHRSHSQSVSPPVPLVVPLVVVVVVVAVAAAAAALVITANRGQNSALDPQNGDVPVFRS